MCGDRRFDPYSLETRYAPLDELGRALWLPAITNTEGRLASRLAAVSAWYKRLLAGELAMVAGDPWPASDILGALSCALDRLDLPALTRGHPEISEQVIRSLLWHIDRLVVAIPRLGRDGAVAAVVEAFVADWDAQRSDMKEVLRVFESLDGIATFARWSELRGVLEDDSWQAVLSAHEAIATLPELAALVRRIGRARPVEEFEVLPGAVQRSEAESTQWVRRLADARLAGAARETEGVRRSGDLNRLLPSESMLYRARTGSRHDLTRRRLRRLFAARLHEQALLTYEQRETWVEPEWVLETIHTLQERPVLRRRLESGPMIVCIDTSASMAGGPEAVAKAVVLEAMRTAARERRACILLSFSGPGELSEMELGADVDSVKAVAQFLSRSFHGGTDIVEPFERALSLIEDAGWRNADLVIASDGEFGPTPALLERACAVRRQTGMRVQGILIGDRETLGLRKTCDEIYWVRNWRRFGLRHGQEAPPVHDRNLTGIYFPNAGAMPGQARQAVQALGTRSTRDSKPGR